MIALALLLAQSPAQTPPQPEFTRESSLFGMVVSGAGDQDGDGTPDLFVGEEQMPFLDSWLLSGKDGSTLRKMRCLWETASRAEVLDVPDVDGDGKRELLLCGRPYDAVQHTELRLFSGGSLERLWRVQVPRPSEGHCIQLVHDVDGDGLEDIGLLKHAGAKVVLQLTLVSSKSGATVRTVSLEPATERGKCGFLESPDLDGDGRRDLVFLEEGAGKKPAVVRAWSPARQQFLWRLEAPHMDRSTTGALAVLGDVDRDGVTDLATTFLDKVSAISGKTGKELYRLNSNAEDDNFAGFGACVLALGDADGDGVGDLVLSEPEDMWSGTLRAYSGRNGKPLWSKSPPFDSDVHRFGLDLALVGDIDGDGISEVIAGSWEAPAATAGYAALISGKSGTPLLEFRRGTAGVVARKPDPKWSWLPPR